MPTAAEPRVERETLRQLNLYEVLQVSAKASPEVVQAAYRVLARSYHPDVNASPHAARMMRQLNAAYRVLNNPERRAKYDAQRAHAWRTRPVPGARAGRVTTAPSMSAVTPGGRSVVVPAVPHPSSWRVGRLVALLLFLLVMMGTLVFAFWMIVGALDDEPHSLMRASMLVGPHLSLAIPG